MIAAMPRLPPQMLRIMRRQHGLVTRTQVIACGVPPRVLQGWVRRGVLEQVARGVYRLPALCTPPEQALLAAVLRCGDGARAGGFTSAWLHRLEGITLPAPPDVVIPTGRHLRRDALPCTVRSTVLPRLDRTTRLGVPCVSATRALIEIAPRVTDKALRVALDSARRRRLTSLTLLRSRVKALADHAGSRVVARLLASGEADPESEGERVMQRFLAPLGLPLEWGVTDLVPGRRLDAAYRAGLVAFEYDGRDHHVLPTDRDADGLRDLEATARDVLVVRITAGMIRDRPQETLAWIARICRDRASRRRPA
jgi:hypothetical protein